MKDHEIAQLVNALRDCAVEYHDAQQLRERIAALVVPALRGRRSPEPQLLVAECSLSRAREELRSALTTVDKVRRDIGERRLEALQQTYSGITAGAETPSQVVDFGAAAQTRTGDLLITNQGEQSPKTQQNQALGKKQPATQIAQEVPRYSTSCETVTAALDLIRLGIQDASRLIVVAGDSFPKVSRLARPTLEAAAEQVSVIAQCFADLNPNARWLSLAHTLCSDAGVPHGHIAERLEGLRRTLDERFEALRRTFDEWSDFRLRDGCKL